jgi:hypothetical protein
MPQIAIEELFSLEQLDAIIAIAIPPPSRAIRDFKTDPAEDELEPAEPPPFPRTTPPPPRRRGGGKKARSSRDVARSVPVRRGFIDDVKHELWLLVCTDDRKYSDLRRALQWKGNKLKPYPVVTSMAICIGHYVGLAEGLIVPVIANLLRTALVVGTAAFCRTFSEDIPT